MLETFEVDESFLKTKLHAVWPLDLRKIANALGHNIPLTQHWFGSCRVIEISVGHIPDPITREQLCFTLSGAIKARKYDYGFSDISEDDWAAMSLSEVYELRRTRLLALLASLRNIISY